MKTLILNGDVGYEITAAKIRNEIDVKSKEALKIYINTPGGSVVEAFDIYNIFKSYKGKIEFVISGMAASAGSYIIMSGDKISGFKNSIFMAHKAWTVMVGSSDDMKKEAEILSGIDNILAESYVLRMNKNKAEILEMMKDEIWLIGWEALTENGIIDDLIDPDNIEDDVDVEEIHQAAAILKVHATKKRLEQDAEKLREDFKRVAKWIPAKVTILDTEGEIVQEFLSEEIPIENNINQEEAKMDLQEFLKSSPEAQAEFDNLLISAKAEDKENLKAAIQAERERISAILEFEVDEISPIAISAIEGEKSVADYTAEKLKALKEKRENVKPSSFGKFAPKGTPADQAPDIAGKSVEEFDAESEALAKKLFSKGGK